MFRPDQSAEKTERLTLRFDDSVARNRYHAAYRQVRQMASLGPVSGHKDLAGIPHGNPAKEYDPVAQECRALLARGEYSYGRHRLPPQKRLGRVSEVLLETGEMGPRHT